MTGGATGGPLDGGRRFDRRSTIRAALMTTGSAYVSYVAGLFVTAALARAMGPQDYGVYAYFLWLAGLLGSAYNSGFVSTSIRFISEALGRNRPDQSRAVMGWLRRRYLVGVGIATTGFVLLGPWIRPSTGSQVSLLLMLMAIVGAMSKSAFTLLASFGKGYGRFEVESLTTSVLALINVVGVLVLVFFRVHLLGFAAFFVALCIAHWALGQRLAVRAGIRPSSESLDVDLRQRVGITLRWSVLFALLAAFSASSIETYLLSRYAGSADVAYFSLALSFARAGVTLFIVGISSTVLPVLAHAYGRAETGGAAKLAERAVRYTHLLGMAIAGLGFFLAFPAVRLLYGENYIQTVWILQCIIVAKAFTVSTGVLTALFVANDQQRGRTSILAFTMLVNMGVAFLLVPRFGLVGAVISSVLSGTIDLGIMLVVAAREFGLRLPLNSLLRITACGMVAATPAYVVSRFSHGVVLEIVAAVIFFMIYFPLAFMFGRWELEDMSIFRGAAAKVLQSPRVAKLLEHFRR